MFSVAQRFLGFFFYPLIRHPRPPPCRLLQGRLLRSPRWRRPAPVARLCSRPRALLSQVLCLTLPFCALDVAQPAAVQTQGQVNDENRRPQRRRSGNSCCHLSSGEPRTTRSRSAYRSCPLLRGRRFQGAGLSGSFGVLCPRFVFCLTPSNADLVAYQPGLSFPSHREQTNKESLQRAKPSN